MATKKKVAKKSTAKKATTKKAATKKAPAKKVAKKKATTKKAVAKKAPAKKATTKKATTKKAVAKKAAPKKAAPKKAAPKKAVAKKAAPKKAAAKKAPAKKAAAKVEPLNKKPVRKAASVSTQNVTVQPLYGDPYKFKKGEEYMNESQVEHFKNILNAWKDDLMQEVDRTVHHMQDEAANFPDPNDRASQETEFALELRARDRGRKLVKKIDESIAMLKSEDYGYCEICGVEIGVRRLEARPTANQCIDCKTLDEIKEKQMG